VVFAQRILDLALSLVSRRVWRGVLLDSPDRLLVDSVGGDSGRISPGRSLPEVSLMIDNGCVIKFGDDTVRAFQFWTGWCRMRKKLVLAVSLGLIGGAFQAAAEKAYRECRIVNGQVTGCGSWYQGKAVAWESNAYRLCSIANGRLGSCGTWYQGDAVVFHDSAFRECRIVNGQLSGCDSWFQGTTVLLHE